VRTVQGTAATVHRVCPERVRALRLVPNQEIYGVYQIYVLTVVFLYVFERSERTKLERCAYPCGWGAQSQTKTTVNKTRQVTVVFVINYGIQLRPQIV